MLRLRVCLPLLTALLANPHLLAQPASRVTFLPPRAEAAASARKDAAARAVAPVLRSELQTFVHLHNREAVVLPTRRAEPLLDRLLRDRVNWEEREIDRRTLAAVRDAAEHFGARRVEVVSGYRSDKLNESLRKKGRHVASHSQHVAGTAVDFRLVGVPVAVLHRYLDQRHNGGVGIYRDNAFVHVDMGARRRWRGE